MRASILFLAPLFLAACGGSGSSGDGGGNSAPYVTWEHVDAKFHPQILNENINLAGAEKVDMDLLGFDKDVRVVYSKDLAADQAILRRYSVWDDHANFGSIYKQMIGKTLSIDNDTGGQVADCSIRVTNGEIAAVKGGCYVRVELVMPSGSQIEVYNLHQLISRRFIAMSNDELILKFDGAAFAKDQDEVMNEYLDSYQAVERTPSLSAHELAQLTDHAAFKDDKMTVLTRLGRYVSDRDHLEDEVVSKFTVFDRNDARRVLGLPEKEGYQ